MPGNASDLREVCNGPCFIWRTGSTAMDAERIAAPSLDGRALGSAPERDARTGSDQADERRMEDDHGRRSARLSSGVAHHAGQRGIAVGLGGSYLRCRPSPATPLNLPGPIGPYGEGMLRAAAKHGVALGAVTQPQAEGIGVRALYHRLRNGGSVCQTCRGNTSGLLPHGEVFWAS